MTIRMSARSRPFSCARPAIVVREAGSGAEARDILAAGPICLALVDYAMPIMSGFEFARLARSIQPDLPVIYVTGAADTLGRDRVPLG